MSGERTPDEIIANLLAEQRADGYERAFKRGVEALCMFATYLAGTRGLTRIQEMNLRTAVGQLLSDAECAHRSDLSAAPIPYPRAVALKEHARAEFEATVERLGRRKKT